MAAISIASHAGSLIRAQVDFERPGFQTGYLEVPYSRDRSAYGHIPIPVVVINNGIGPRLLLTGGNHGDEYEGPIALSKLIQRLKDEPIQGRLIIIPTLNLPAVLNASRTSPIDGGNLNRLFPGRRDGSVTEMIAHYVETELFPLVDGALDLHAGGASFDHLPTLLTAVPTEGKARADYMRLVHAFAAPRALLLDMLGEDRTYSAAAQRAGIWFIGGEFGGGSHCDPDCLKIVEDGVRRVLRELGVTPRDEPPVAQYSTRMLTMHGRSHYVFARHSGIFEPCYHLGDNVRKGQLAGRVFAPHAPWEPAHELYFEGDGIVMCARTYADVEPGDCVAMLACDAAGQG
ncbi:succinylglutamate desuccinylase/aspartoacylase family protein [Bordetella genomosp. 4]|uniref:Succinylglutamate desuccinylase n=1 Tax=Bordetella genomosp. 4 TaxID=463044 RepID=A0A261U398_9BORD|nr:succinylglutamate desuccinylase/aspartoacylase family protein [Bordetella genomosp. 4]OZI56021.1 succinylglutamate desuccinylase [Bordetella genomosp. 4]